LSEIRATTISDAAGTGPITLTGQSAAKAWVNFNQAGTDTINNSFNVSSLTDSGTGLTYINFSSAMAYAGFSLSHSTIVDSNYVNAEVTNYPITASQAYFISVENGFGYDKTYASCIAHGDLA
jgi:hypothetical protein